MANKKTLQSILKTKGKNLPKVNSVLDQIFTDALTKKATSIHLERHGDQAKLRYRLNRELKTVAEFSGNLQEKLSQHLESLANVPRGEISSEGRFKITYNKKSINIRVAFWPTYEGEKITIKILGEQNNDLRKLINQEKDFSQLNKDLQSRAGLILLAEMKLDVKNRLLYSLLDKLDKELLDIFTLEDFIEYPLIGIHQQQLDNFSDEKVGATLEKLSRYQPDVVMVSKIAGPYSARQIINMAANNLVLTYLPGNNLKESLTFFKAWGIDDYILESVLKSIITFTNNQYKII